MARSTQHAAGSTRLAAGSRQQAAPFLAAGRQREEASASPRGARGSSAQRCRRRRAAAGTGAHTTRAGAAAASCLDAGSVGQPVSGLLGVLPQQVGGVGGVVPHGDGIGVGFVVLEGHAGQALQGGVGVGGGEQGLVSGRAGGPHPRRWGNCGVARPRRSLELLKQRCWSQHASAAGSRMSGSSRCLP